MIDWIFGTLNCIFLLLFGLNLPIVTVEEALAHPYLERLHDIADEPICMEPFSFEFEQHALTEDQMKELIYNEAISLNPQYGH